MFKSLILSYILKIAAQKRGTAIFRNWLIFRVVHVSQNFQSSASSMKISSACLPKYLAIFRATIVEGI